MVKILATRSKRQQGLTLVELLIGMVILGIVSTMLFMTWFSLSRSYAYSVNSAVARDDARQAIARMEREIRGAQASTSAPPIVRAHPYWICFSTTFNNAGNDTPTAVPHLVVYRLYSDGSLWRFEDGNGDGTITASGTPIIGTGNVFPSDRGACTDLSQTTSGEGAMLLCRSVLEVVFREEVLGETGETPLFMYNSYSDLGTLESTLTVPASNYQTAEIVAVRTHLRVDLSPSRAPVNVDFVTTATLRN